MRSEAVIVSALYGRYHDYAEAWIRNLRAVGCSAAIHLIVLDQRERSFCGLDVSVKYSSVDMPTRGSGDYVRLKAIRELCESGRIALQIDIDVCFNIDPLSFAALPYNFIISRGMGFPESAIKSWGFSLCTGFYIAKPNGLPLLDDWIGQERVRNGLDQEDLNLMLLEKDLRWKHASSQIVTDSFAVSEDSQVCVLPDRAITRDWRFHSFGGIHNQAVLSGLGVHSTLAGEGN